MVWRKGGIFEGLEFLSLPSESHTSPILVTYPGSGHHFFFFFFFFFNAPSGCLAGALSGIPTMLVPQVSDNFL